ncbi:MAG TPA: outer membrane lipoprotein chaperone LolA [Gammaproteobacteria bacterium]|nr:outer membrane lipoprotein chaperone LolA [Gammaproteobacteria bacterium]
MQVKKIIVGFLIGFLGCSYLNTALADPTASANLTQLLQNLKTFTADFSQVIQDNHGNALQESSGRVALERPGHFRWNTLKPNQQLIVADGKYIWIYDKDLQEVQQKKQTEDTQSPALLLSDSVVHLTKRFSVTSPDKNDFKLVPVKKDLFQSVELIFNSQGTLTTMTLHDNLGQTTQIQFTHTATNQSLPSNLFKFTPPKNTDVITG